MDKEIEEMDKEIEKLDQEVEGRDNEIEEIHLPAGANCFGKVGLQLR